MTLHRAADNVTNMIGAHLTLLSLAPENFFIKVSMCHNYTENLTKGMQQARYKCMCIASHAHDITEHL